MDVVFVVALTSLSRVRASVQQSTVSSFVGHFAMLVGPHDGFVRQQVESDVSIGHTANASHFYAAVI